MAKIPQTPLNCAMTLLSRRGLSEKELRDKLLKKAFPPDEAEKAVAECLRRGYLNDELLTADCIEALRSRNAGSRMIRQKLARRGLDRELIEQTLADAPPEDETEAARRAMEGKLRTLTRETDPRKKREKLFRFLAGRGFAPDLIFRLIGESGEF